ncbi:MAG: cytochrome c [Chloroflexota bacterium]
MTKILHSRILQSLLVIIVILLVGYASLYYFMYRLEPISLGDADGEIEEYYKYGSVGTENATGVPYYIWAVLPDLFPEHLPGPGGYASLGMVWEEGQEMPVGFTKYDVGVIPRAGINCATCHAATYRTSPDAEPVVINAGPSSRFDTLGYQKFLFESADDPKFTTNLLMDAINESFELSPFERWSYRYGVIPFTKKILREQKRAWAWSYENPPWGPGRIDPFNPIKYDLLGMDVDGSVGNSDMMPIWALALRDGHPLHWDGLNTSVREVVLSSAIGDGARPGNWIIPNSLNLEVMQRIEEYLMTVEPPAYPFEIDDALATSGEEIFTTHCADCHMPGQGRTGEIISVEEVGTDENRVIMWNQAAADAYNAEYSRYFWGFENFQNVDGYASVPLNGVWLRAPYLHNGSVPTLTALLEAPENRPKRFYRGYDVYDPTLVGFVSDVAEEPSTGIKFFAYDVSVLGNSNQGHLYGTELSDDEKKALIEYLKQL